MAEVHGDNILKLGLQIRQALGETQGHLVVRTSHKLLVGEWGQFLPSVMQFKNGDELNNTKTHCEVRLPHAMDGGAASSSAMFMPHPRPCLQCRCI